MQGAETPPRKGSLVVKRLGRTGSGDMKATDWPPTRSDSPRTKAIVARGGQACAARPADAIAAHVSACPRAWVSGPERYKGRGRGGSTATAARARSALAQIRHVASDSAYFY